MRAISVAKTLIKIISACAVTLLLALCSIWIFRAPIVQWLADKPLPNGWVLQLTGLTSSSIGQWKFAKFSLVKEGSVYFTLEQGEIIWQPSLLWQKKLLIERVSVQSATFYQQPPKQNTEFKAPDFTGLPSIAANQIDIKHLILAGTDPTENISSEFTQEDYAFEGDFQLLWDEVFLQLNGQLKNQNNIIIAQVDTDVHPDKTLEITAKLDEPKGGMLARRLSLPITHALKADAIVEIGYEGKDYLINLQQLDFPWRNQFIQSTGTLWVNAAQDTFDLRELNLSIGEHKQLIKALLTPSERTVHAQLEQFPVDFISPWVPLEDGEISGDFNIYWQNQTAQLTADAKGNLNSNWQGWPLKLKGEFNYSAQQLITLKKAEATWGEGKLKSIIKADGVLDIRGEQNNLTASSTHFTNEHLHNLPIVWLSQPKSTLARELNKLKFSADVTSLTLKGPLNNPTVNYLLDAQTKWQQHEFDLHLQGDGNLTGANLRQTRVQQGEGQIELNGHLDWAGTTTKAQLDFKQWGEAFWNTYQLNKMTEVKALVNGQAQLTGTLSAPRITTQLTLTGELPLSEPAPFIFNNKAQFQYTFAKPWPAGLSLLSTENTELTVAGTSRLQVQGSFNTRAIDLTIRCPQWDTELNRLLEIPLADGSGNLELNITGTIQAPQIRGQWQYEIPLGAQPLTWHGTLNSENNYLSVISELNEAEANLAHFNGRYRLENFNNPTNLDAQIELKANLSASRLFLDARRFPLTGALDMNLNIAGPRAQPQINGTMNIIDGFFADKVLSNEYKNINLNLALQNNQLNVQKGEARDNDDGTLKITGGCPQIYPAATCDIKFAFDELQIIKNPQLFTRASGEINTSVADKQIKAIGALTLSPTTLTLANSTGSTIRELVVEEVNRRRKQSAGILWPSPYVDIQWQLGSNSQVRGRGLEAQIAGAFRTQGPLNQMEYRGNFYTTKGTMELFNKRFILGNGDIRLAPGQIYLNIPAQYQSRVNSGEDLTINARLHGDLNHLNLDLQSTPPLPPDEVLARLIFGKQVQNITPFEGIQLAGAVQQLRSGNSFSLMDSARTFLDVDRLNIESQKNTDGTSGVNVGVGKYISDKVYVEVQRTPNPNNPWQGQIEIELTPKVNFESNTGDHGQGGAKLLWRKDY
ncbi:MAG TPA: translocation/assembly module TamB domain-containing protein [Cellvibrionaceae bacterium]